MIPTPNAGVKPWIGNKKPVRLVNTVVSKNSALLKGSRREANIPPTTINPLPMAMRVIATCKSVKAPVDNPKIMIGPR